MKQTLLLTAAILLTGCATYSHPSKDDTQFQADRYECERDAAGVKNDWQAIGMMDRCMKVKGWRTS